MMGSTLFYFILALFVLVVFHEAGHFWVARAFGVQVLRFSFGFGKVLCRRRDKQGTEYVWSLIPLGGYVTMLDETREEVPIEARHRAFNTQPVWVRLLIVLAGPAFNFLFAWIAFGCVAMIGVPIVQAPPPVIGAVQQLTPAARAGLMAGDRIIAVDETPVTDWWVLVDYVKKRPDQAIVLTFKRGNEQKNTSVTLGHQSHQHQQDGWLGVRSKPLSQVTDSVVLLHRETPWQAARIATIKTWDTMKSTSQLMLNLFQGTQSLQSISGPVGIAQYAGYAAHAGVVYYLSFLAVVSVSLGVLNLLPIPMLDGGHVVYNLIEIVRRRPLSVRAQSIGSGVGFALLMMLMVVALKNDLIRLFGS